MLIYFYFDVLYFSTHILVMFHHMSVSFSHAPFQLGRMFWIRYQAVFRPGAQFCNYRIIFSQTTFQLNLMLSDLFVFFFFCTFDYNMCVSCEVNREELKLLTRVARFPSQIYLKHHTKDHTKDLKLSREKKISWFVFFSGKKSC